MTGEEDKHRKQKITGIDESSSNRQTNGWTTGSNSSRVTTKNREDQPLFKKPRLDVSFVMLPEFQCHDGSIILRNCERLSRLDDGKSQDLTTAECVGECCTCGDTGFETELFRCTKCSVRLQHTYCSNSYNPRKRWFIGLCNWCEMDVARSGVKQEAAATQGTKRENLLNAPWIEKRNAVDCLLGAALRLPSAGLSNMEDLLPQGTRGASKGRRSPSFDTVEKAKRSSGPSCDSAVKTSTKRPSSDEKSTVQHQQLKRILSSGLDKVTGHGNSKSHLAIAADTTNGGKGNETEVISTSATTSSDSLAEKRLRPAAAGENMMARKSSPSVNVVMKNSRKSSPTGDYDDKSDTTVDNTVPLRTPTSRRSPSRCTSTSIAGAAAAVMRSEGCDGGSSRSTKIHLQDQSPISSRETTGNSGNNSIIRKSSLHVDSTRGAFVKNNNNNNSSEDRSDSGGGGSDCSNVTEVQRSGGGRDTPPSQSRKSQSFKAARLVGRPSLTVGKSSNKSSSTITQEPSKTPKKFADVKDPKLRRSTNSPRVTGTHFKCLSDILC